jgi:hypothetical protein
VLGRVVLDQAGPLAPAQEGDNLGGALVDGVVRRVAGGAETEQIGLGQRRRVTPAGLTKQGRQGAAVVVGRLGVGVAAAERLDQGEQVAQGRSERPVFSV